jgi:hypothetical protein
MEPPPITLLQAWTPTFVTTFLIALCGILLAVKIARDERRSEEKERKNTQA